MCANNNYCDCLDTSLITIPNGAIGANGAPGTNGTNGIDGQDGDFGGFSTEYIFDTTTGGAPSSTFLRLSHSLFSDVTSISLHDENTNGIDVGDMLNSFSNTVDGTNNFGLIRVWKKFSSSDFWCGKITDVVDLGTSVRLAVTYIDSNGSFLNGEGVVISFAPSGAKAEADKEILVADHTQTSNGTTSLTSLTNYTVPANTLLTNGDQLSVSAAFKVTTTIPSALHARVRVGGNDITPGAINWLIGSGFTDLLVNFTLTRTSSTTVYLNMKSFVINPSGILTPSYGNSTNFAFNSSVNNLIDLLGLSVDGLGNTIAARELIIKKFNI